MKQVFNTSLIACITTLYCSASNAHQGHHHVLGEVHSHMPVETSLLVVAAIVIGGLIASKL